MIPDLPISSVEIRLYLDVNNNDTLDVADTLSPQPIQMVTQVITVLKMSPQVNMWSLKFSR